jgi:hypothetical protein
MKHAGAQPRHKRWGMDLSRLRTPLLLYPPRPLKRRVWGPLRKILKFLIAVDFIAFLVSPPLYNGDGGYNPGQKIFNFQMHVG